MVELREGQRGRAMRDSLLEGAVIGIGRNLGLEKYPKVHKTLSNSGENA